ncbi:hypothetical protein QCA50_020381 [Cerrena zonata]|uniref:Uncharacterized protein n=1 Tax=Cerrena zonata TaxID=2478898 RepID=A0AAW0FGF8_9APHY
MALVTVGPLVQASYLEDLICEKYSLFNARDLDLQPQHVLDPVLGTDLLLVINIAPRMSKSIVLFHLQLLVDREYTRKRSTKIS